MLSLLGLLTGLAGPISALGGKLADLWLARQKATTDYERAAIDRQIQESHDRQAVLVAEAGSRLAGGLNASMRFLIALGPMLLLNKYFIWDKVIGSFWDCAGSKGLLPRCDHFTTDGLDSNLWWVVMAVIGFYFLYSIVDKVKS